MVGTVVDGVLLKKVKRSKHLYRVHDAWAFDKGALLDAMRGQGASAIQVTDTEEGIVYEIDMMAALEVGIQIDHGHGIQLAIPRASWAQAPLKGFQPHEQGKLL